MRDRYAITERVDHHILPNKRAGIKTTTYYDGEPIQLDGLGVLKVTVLQNNDLLLTGQVIPGLIVRRARYYDEAKSYGLPGRFMTGLTEVVSPGHTIKLIRKRFLRGQIEVAVTNGPTNRI